jgi:hypothetical protein
MANYPNFRGWGVDGMCFMLTAIWNWCQWQASIARNKFAAFILLKNRGMLPGLV